MTQNKKGILTGCDAQHEWMLKWWWSHYRTTNSYPVTFIDFGMTPGAKCWCEKQGTLLSLLESRPGLPPKAVSPYARSKRSIWLSKPEALLKSPYQKTIWIDIDAKVKQPLSSLFALCPENTLALCPEVAFRANAEREAGLIPQKAVSYNTGVIVYPKKARLLLQWAKVAKKSQALGDQDLLSRLIFEKKLPVKLLPSMFNRIHPDSDDPRVVIYHYASQMGQIALLQNMQPQRTQ